MSDTARFWSRHLRGNLNFGEHAIARELAEYHNQGTNLVYPRLDTIATNFEISRPHLKRIMNRLETWRLMWRKEEFELDKNGRQTSNRYILNFERHFPDPLPEGRTTRDKNPNPTHGKKTERQPGPRPYDKRDLIALAGAEAGRRLLKAIHQVLRNDQTLVLGVKEAFLQKTAPAAEVPTPAILWVAIESESAELRFIERLGEIVGALRRDPINRMIDFELELLPLFDRQKTKRATDLKI